MKQAISVHLTHFCFVDIFPFIYIILNSALVNRKVVQQFYQTRVIDEFVLLKNSALLKCHVPSFIADFVEVEAWVGDDGNEILPNSDNFGMHFTSKMMCIIQSSRTVYTQSERPISMKRISNTKRIYPRRARVVFRFLMSECGTVLQRMYSIFETNLSIKIHTLHSIPLTEFNCSELILPTINFTIRHFFSASVLFS